MNRTIRKALLGCALVGTLRAQSTPADPAAATTPPVPPAESVVKLNPFEVQEGADKGYSALNSNSITRFNTALDKLPVSATIFDQTFMNDVGATNVEDMITMYAAGAGYEGGGGASVAGTSQPGDRNGNAYIQLRGQSTPVEQRDGLMPVGAFGNPGSTGVGQTSTFDLERAEVIMGPQGLLYGGGGAGGVINVVSKQAELGKPAFGSAMYRIDQYGSKLAQFDYGVGTDNFAIRIATLNSVLSSRRINIGADTDGQYIQIAWKPFKNTTIRLETEQTVNQRFVATSPTVTLATADPRNGDTAHYLLATNQAGATNPLTGAAYPSGAIDNGLLNWSNVDSYQGWQEYETTVNEYSSIQADTVWTSWLSTQFAAGYDPYEDTRENQGFSMYAPGASGNPLTGWTAGVTPGGDTWEPAQTKGIRFTALATNDLFDGKVHSQTILGQDYLRTTIAQEAYEFVQADSNWNQIISSAVAQTGYIPLAKQYYSIDKGFIQYPLFYPNVPRFSYNGQNYIRVLTNPVNPAAISPANPTGAVLTSGNYIITKILNGGFFGTNYTQFFDGRFTTMAGFRMANSEEERINQGLPGSNYFDTHVHHTSFNLGATVELLSWLNLYGEVSDSYQPPYLENATDPYNRPPDASIGLGQEAGLKFQTKDGTISGTLDYYHTSAANESYAVSSTISADINPSGLNGGGGGSTLDESIASHGVELKVTANPIPNLRLYFAAAYTNGTLGKTAIYPQLYNDQFNTNSSGQVTYADGTVVYVAPTFNSKAAAYTSANAPAGSVPLTVTSLSTPGGLYYANPVALSGQINSSSAAAAVLKTVDPTHGAILTGKSGLPISDYQLNTALTGFSPPGAIIAAEDGQFTTGQPTYAISTTGVYTFTNGFMRGIRIGGSEILQWRYRGYYYYPVAPTAATIYTDVPVLFDTPEVIQTNLILGYSHKFGRITWSSQLNVSNLFNHYVVEILPATGTGYGTPTGLNASWFGQPRFYQWTNTISF